MAEPDGMVIRVVCPCCNAVLAVEGGSGAVKEWRVPQDQRKSADLRDAAKVLDEEKAAVEARFQEIVRADKEKGPAMDRKFREFLEKGRGGTPDKPLRDIDLD